MSKKLIIREFSSGDLEKQKEIDAFLEVSKWQLRNDENIDRLFFGPIDKNKSVAIRSVVKGIWPLMTVECENEMVGYVSFFPIDQIRECILGWNFHPAIWGKGYAKEALEEVLKLIRESGCYPQIKCYTSADNIRCIKFMRKIGFTPGGGHYGLVDYYNKLKKTTAPVVAYQISGVKIAKQKEVGVDENEKVKDAFLYLNSRGKQYVLEKMAEYGISENRAKILFDEHISKHNESLKSNSLFDGKIGLNWSMVCWSIVALMFYLMIKSFRN